MTGDDIGDGATLNLLLPAIPFLVKEPGSKLLTKDRVAAFTVKNSA